MKMNFKKGFFRATIIISACSFIIGMAGGINNFLPVYKKFDKNVKAYEIYYQKTFDLLNDVTQEPKTDSSETLERLKKRLRKYVIYGYDLRVISNIKRFEIKKELLNDLISNSDLIGEHITVDALLKNSINKKMDYETKKRVSQECAMSLTGDISFPWAKLFLYLLLIPLAFGGIVWIIYFAVKFIVVGFNS